MRSLCVAPGGRSNIKIYKKLIPPAAAYAAAGGAFYSFGWERSDLGNGDLDLMTAFGGAGDTVDDSLIVDDLA